MIGVIFLKTILGLGNFNPFLKEFIKQTNIIHIISIFITFIVFAFDKIVICKSINELSFHNELMIWKIITFLIINSSIRLSIYSNRQLIKTMQLVGATKSFIRKPFLKTNAFLSLISSFLSISLIILIINYLDNNINFLKNIESKTIFILCFFIVLLGLTISYISTFFATQNILKIKADKLDI